MSLPADLKSAIGQNEILKVSVTVCSWFYMETAGQSGECSKTVHFLREYRCYRKKAGAESLMHAPPAVAI